VDTNSEEGLEERLQMVHKGVLFDVESYKGPCTSLA